MRTLFAVALVGWFGLFARPLVRRCLAPERLDGPTVTWTAAGLGLGLVTLVPFWMMLAVPGGPAFAAALAASAVVAAVGWLGPPPPQPDDGSRHVSTRRPGGRDRLGRALHGAIGLICASLVFTSVYWPFDVGDALALYAPWARHLYATATLPIGDRLYEGYPMLVPMAYAFTHWAAGGVNEYVARLVPALMAVGVVAVSGLVGRAMGSARTGLWAAALVALTPIFGRWASTGYTDIPAAFYVGLTVLFAWRWWLTGSVRAIALAGLCAGLAAWTKNSTLTLVPSLVALLATFPAINARWPASARMPSRSIVPAAAVFAATFLLVAGPWYLRSQIEFGFAVPPTMLTDRADHTPWALAIMLRPDQSFGPSGLAFTLAPAAGAILILRRRDRSAAASYVLLVCLLPFVAAWWWLASYEARFLLAVIPLLAAMGALAIEMAEARIVPRLSPRARRVAALVMLAVVVLTTAVAWRRTLMHKNVLLRNPWPSDAERHQVRLGGLYELVTALNALPADARVGGVPAIVRYYLPEERLRLTDSSPQSASPDRLQDRFDAVVYRDPAGRTLTWSVGWPPLLRTADGYLLYPTRPSAPTSNGHEP